MYLVLVAIAWVYVVLLMAMTEQSFIAGVMTFLLYCVVPLSIILYLMGTPGRKRRRQRAEDSQRASANNPVEADEKPVDTAPP
jgi:membrane protein implicated in regulation of membrane protease activity